MSEIVQDPLPDILFVVEARIIAHSNSAANFYYTETVEMFAFEKYENGDLLLLLTEESRKSIDRESIKEYIDYLKIDPDNVESHPGVESIKKIKR